MPPPGVPGSLAAMIHLTRLPTLLAVSAALLAAPTAAHATTASFDGTTVTVLGTDGPDGVDINAYDGQLYVSGSPMAAGPGCDTGDSTSQATCPLPPGGVVVKLLGGDDRMSSYTNDMPTGWATVDLGAGNDFFETSGADTAFGGAGNDRLQAYAQTKDNTFDGGDGNDELNGAAGNDTLRGGAGDDRLVGDPIQEHGADVLDGGPGRDTVDDFVHPDPYDLRPATVTLDGRSDDGIESEGDNVTNVEIVKSASGVQFRGTDGPEIVIAAQGGGKGFQYGMGGDDTLTGSDDDETIDGGAGDDDIRGGYGNDTITGGPGRDKLLGDRDARCNELACDISPGSASDTIDAVDGEADAVSCGPGNDTAKVDAVDTVGTDCETVIRAGGPGGPSGGGTGGGTGGGGGGTIDDPGTGTPPATAPTLTLRGAKTLRALRAGRLAVDVRNLKPGATVRLRVLRAGRLVATGNGRAGTGGSTRVTLRLTASGRRALARSRAATLVVTAGTRRMTVRLGR